MAYVLFDLYDSTDFIILAYFRRIKVTEFRLILCFYCAWHFKLENFLLRRLEIPRDSRMTLFISRFVDNTFKQIITSRSHFQIFQFFMPSVTH